MAKKIRTLHRHGTKYLFRRLLRRPARKRYAAPGRTGRVPAEKKRCRREAGHYAVRKYPSPAVGSDVESSSDRLWKMWRPRI